MRHARPRRRAATIAALGVGAAISLGVLVVAISGAFGQGSKPVDVVLRSSGGVGWVELRSGDASLDDVAKALSLRVAGGILVHDRAAWVLARTLVVARGSTLRLAHTELRLQSEPGRTTGLEARGGNIDINDSRVTSWDTRLKQPDRQEADGRAWVLARDGSRMVVRNSTMAYLGYNRAERYGVAWRMPRTGGAVDRSTFVGNYYGMYTAQAAAMRITGSTFERSSVYGLDPHSDTSNLVIEGNVVRNNGTHGIILAEGCRNVQVRENQVYGNGGHGIVVFAGSDNAVVSRNETHDNIGAGIDVDRSAHAHLGDNLVFANGTGVAVHDGANGVLLVRNKLTGNRGDGVAVSTGGTITTMTLNVADLNGRAGIFLGGGTAIIGPANRLTKNDAGIWVAGSNRSRVQGNRIVENVLDGVHLDGAAGIVISGNVIDQNRKAAFSVNATGQARDFLVNNSVGSSADKERVRYGNE